MVEFSHHPEIPDYTNPEYWSGHTLSDGCPNHPVEGRGDRKAMQFAKQELEDFLSITGRKDPEIRLEKGQEFRTASYPPGTIVRFQTEDYFDPVAPESFIGASWGVDTPHDRGQIVHGTFHSYGVVTPLSKDQHKRTLVRFSVSEGKETLYGNPSPLFENMKMGEVYHLQERYLMRPDWLEVLKFGGGIPVRAETRLSGFWKRLSLKPTLASEKI